MYTAKFNITNDNNIRFNNNYKHDIAAGVKRTFDYELTFITNQYLFSSFIIHK